MGRCRWVPALLLAGLALAQPARAEDLVPDAVGLELPAARALLAQAGYEVVLEYVPGAASGRVVGQQPGGLTAMAKGGLVRLRVGGERPVPPALPGPPPAGPGAPPQAEGPEDVLPPTGPLPPLEPVPPGPVAPAPPAAPAEPGPAPTAPAPQTVIDWSRAEPGRLLDRNGPPLPSALGLRELEARQALAAWGVRVEQTVGIPDLVGRVVNQAPRPGAPLAPGETVTIAVAVLEMPADLAGVPAVVAMSAQDAVDAVVRAGFVYRLRLVEGQGQVLAQRPLGGSLHVPGGDVFLFIGRGGLPALPPPAPRAPVPRAAPAAPAPVPGVPTPISPSEGQSAPQAYGSTFQWTAVPGATGYELELQREERDGAYTTIAMLAVEGTRLRPERLEAGRLRWRVRATAGGVAGAWSPYFRLFLYGP